MVELFVFFSQTMLFSFLVPQASGSQTQDGKSDLNVALLFSKSISLPVQGRFEWIFILIHFFDFVSVYYYVGNMIMSLMLKYRVTRNTVYLESNDK